MMLADPFHLQRFVEAQRGLYPRVVAELQAGRKRSHWMWFVFPQIAGLGHSEMAQRFAISSKDEGTAYLQHELLGPRLIEATELVLGIQGRPVTEIFGAPDDLKFKSSMTLFEAVSGRPTFTSAIEKYYGGDRDMKTLALLGVA